MLLLFNIPNDTLGEPARLASLWGTIIQKYPPPKPTQAERDSLTWAYEQLAAKSQACDERELRTIEPSPPDETYVPLNHDALKPYLDHIRLASMQFEVPEAIIGGVILQESGGRARVKAKTSSAKGLMQTIDATFAFARRHLSDLGIVINDPYKPEDSIIAGTWYLSYCFELAKEDYPMHKNRAILRHWKKSLEYYYAGPKWGKRPEGVVHARIGNRKIVIKKDWYAKKVLSRAYAL